MTLKKMTNSMTKNNEEITDIYQQITCKNKLTGKKYYLFTHAVRSDKWVDGAKSIYRDDKKYLYTWVIQSDPYGHLYTEKLRKWWIDDIIDAIDITPEEFEVVRDKSIIYEKELKNYRWQLQNEMDEKIDIKTKQLQKENKVVIKRK